MAESTFKPTPPPQPIRPPLRERLAALMLRFKTNRTLQIIFFSGLLAILLISISLFLISRTRSRLAFIEPPLTLPSPSPQKQTSLTNNPTLLEIEASIASASSKLKDLRIRDHPLLPPTIDVQVTLEN